GGPLVGRERELELLKAALTRARLQRSLELVTLAGVPGDRQEPPRHGALRLDRARRAGLAADLLAPGQVVALRRRRQLLGAGGDGQGARGHPRDRQRRRCAGKADTRT